VRTIAEITKAVMAEQRIDATRVYITGISAGGIMASVMAASYPQLYSALAVVAGCSYLCSDSTGDLTYARMTESHRTARVVPTILFQGSTDYVVNDGLGEMAVAGWVGANDLADDGQANGSVSRTPSSTEHYRLDPYSMEPNPYPPDHDSADIATTCLHIDPPKGNNPCPGEMLGWTSYPYTIRRFNFTSSSTIVVESWLIHGVSHNYTGGSPNGDATYVDPIGPNITQAAWDFFTRSSRAIRP
jgi:poly(3-hydroxybutyrate) depolymerase